MKTFPAQFSKTFSQKVVELALLIPSGKVSTYGHIARAASGGRQAARSVNAILVKAYEAGDKDFKKRIPFHRIVYAGGKVWLSSNCESMRMKLYKKEGIEVDEKGYVKNFVDTLYQFK